MSKGKKKQLTDEQIVEMKNKGTGHGDRLEAIAKNVSKEHFEEAGYQEVEEKEEKDGDIDSGPEPDNEKDDQQDDDSADEESESKKQKGKEKQPPDTDFITLKVDGEEVKKPKAEVEKEGGIESYQKKLAADRRLERATLKQKELEKREAELAEREAAIGKKLPDEDEETETEIETKDKKDAEKDLKKLKNIVSEKRKAYHNAMEFGEAEDIEKAAEELDEAQEVYYETKFNRGAEATQQVDVDKIADQINENLTKKQILSKFQKEFEDVWKDPEAMARAKFEVDLIIKSKPETGDDWQTYETAGKRARQQMGWEEPEKQNPTPEQQQEDKKRQEKIAKKRKIENIDAATAKTEGIKTEEKPKTRSETIADMAQSRIGSHIY